MTFDTAKCHDYQDVSDRRCKIFCCHRVENHVSCASLISLNLLRRV